MVNEQIGFDAFGLLRPSDAFRNRRFDDIGQCNVILPLLIVEEFFSKQLPNKARGAGDEDVHIAGVPRSSNTTCE